MRLFFRQERLTKTLKLELFNKLNKKIKKDLTGKDLINSWLRFARNKIELNIDAKCNNPLKESTQNPVALFIAAADYSIDPHALSGAPQGTFYIIKNVAGVITPSEGNGTDLSIGAALEFGVRVYEIKHIILMTSPHCGLLNCLLNEDVENISPLIDGKYLPQWIKIIASAINRVASQDLSNDERKRLCSQELTKISFENLMTYPWILDKLYEGELNLHGWYHDIYNQEFACFDPTTDSFISS